MHNETLSRSPCWVLRRHRGSTLVHGDQRLKLSSKLVFATGILDSLTNVQAPPSQWEGVHFGGGLLREEQSRFLWGLIPLISVRIESV